MIELNDNTYCLGIWWLEATGVDWLAAVTREGDGPLTLRYRFRYHRDDRAFDSADEKSWWTFTCPTDDEDRIIADLDGLVLNLIRRGFRQPWRRIVRGDAKATLEVLKTAPFASIRSFPEKN